MVDVLTKVQRSYCMSQIRRQGTKPELIVRKLLSSQGIRGYRIDPKMVGRPDLYFPRRKIAVFVDGCFWHRCPECFVRPKTNRSFWTPKIRKNVERDRKVKAILEKSGVAVLRLWEHETKGELSECYTKFKRIYEKRSEAKDRKTKPLHRRRRTKK